MKPIKPMRKVVKFESYQNQQWPGSHTGSHMFLLECGHWMRGKFSQGTPTKKRCDQCPGVWP